MSKLGVLLAAGLLLSACAAQMTAHTIDDYGVPRDGYGQPVLAGAAR